MGGQRAPGERAGGVSRRWIGGSKWGLSGVFCWLLRHEHPWTNSETSGPSISFPCAQCPVIPWAPQPTMLPATEAIFSPAKCPFLGRGAEEAFSKDMNDISVSASCWLSSVWTVGGLQTRAGSWFHCLCFPVLLRE